MATAINETTDAEGSVFAGRFKNGTNNGETDGSHWAAAMATRSRADPGVCALRAFLRAHNGITGLEVCAPHEVERAAKLYHRDGFVVVRDVFTPEQLAYVRQACAEVFAEILAYPGAGGRKYHTESGRLPHRYSYGTTSSSRQMLHHPAWAMLSELAPVCDVLDEIFGATGGKDDGGWAITGAGGDMSIPGAVEYQTLHRDGPPPDFGLQIDSHQFAARAAQAAVLAVEPRRPLRALAEAAEGKRAEELSLVTMRAMSENMPPAATTNFALGDMTWENGPMRLIPGSHCNVQPPPNTADEPDWARCSTIVGVPAGSAIFRDFRTWHSGTPNLSDEVRAMPSIEYCAAWVAGTIPHPKTMPHEIWEQLTPRGKHKNRYVHAEPGIWPAGAGVTHPLSAGRMAAFEATGGSALEKTDARMAVGKLLPGKIHRVDPNFAS